MTRFVEGDDPGWFRTDLPVGCALKPALSRLFIRKVPGIPPVQAGKTAADTGRYSSSHGYRRHDGPRSNGFSGYRVGRGRSPPLLVLDRGIVCLAITAPVAGGPVPHIFISGKENKMK